MYIYIKVSSFLLRPHRSLPPDDREGVASEEEEEEEPFITAYLHSHPLPNEFNCTDRKRITLSQTRGPQPDHRKYTVFLSPE